MTKPQQINKKLIKFTMILLQKKRIIKKKTEFRLYFKKNLKDKGYIPIFFLKHIFRVKKTRDILPFFFTRTAFSEKCNL